MGNVRCNDIKPNERKLFRYLIRQQGHGKYDFISKNDFVKHVKIFAEKTGISYKQIEYYLNKWTQREILFIHGNVVMFKFDKISCYDYYNEMIPERVKRKRRLEVEND